MDHPQRPNQPSKLQPSKYCHVQHDGTQTIAYLRIVLIIEQATNNIMQTFIKWRGSAIMYFTQSATRGEVGKRDL
jgi:hypothetical protein